MHATQSTPVTGTGTVVTGAGFLLGAKLAAAAATATATLYDGTDTSGPILAKLTSAANGSDDLSIPIAFKAGLHVVLSGTGAHLNVFL